VPALVPAFLGALHLGAVPAILPYPSERMDRAVYGRRLAAMVDTAGARGLLTTPGLATVMDEVLGTAAPPLLRLDEIAARAVGAVPVPLPPPSADRVAFLQYSSGTTDLPKGILHTHRRVLDYIAARARHDRLSSDDIVVSWLPLYHDMGLVSGLLTPLVLGLSTVLMSPHHWVRDPGLLFRAIAEHGGTFCWMPNFALNHCARAVRESDLAGVDLSRWRALILGGEPTRLASLRLFVERFAPHGFRESALATGYGMAETVEGVTIGQRGGSPNVDWVSARALREEGRADPVPPESPGGVPIVTCGRPIDGVELAIVGGDGRSLGDRRVGEVRIRSRYMLTGYHRRPDLTAVALRDGWLASGDLGYVADGQLYVCGRLKDLIITGGRNVHPEDVECLADGVAGLRPGRAVAFGLEDAATGTERVVLVCELSEDLPESGRQSIRQTLRRRAAQEQDVVLGDVRLVDRDWLIKTSNGKIARSANREKYRTQILGGGRAGSHGPA
jgi:acyl-CoA synthetase (AMP-forming)/AMP-acid ligase II